MLLRALALFLASCKTITTRLHLRCYNPLRLQRAWQDVVSLTDRQVGALLRGRVMTVFQKLLCQSRLQCARCSERGRRSRSCGRRRLSRSRSPFGNRHRLGLACRDGPDASEPSAPSARTGHFFCAPCYDPRWQPGAVRIAIHATGTDSRSRTHFETGDVYFYMDNGDQRVRCGVTTKTPRP